MKTIISLFLTLTIAGLAMARVTSSSAQRDIWCVGPSGAEVCVDASGNLISTTDDDTDLGTSSLQWKNGYFDGTVYADVISNDGAYTGTSGAFSTTLSASSTTLTGALYIGGGDGIIKTTVTTTGAMTVQSVTTVSEITAGGTITLSAGETISNVGNDVRVGAASFTVDSGSATIEGALSVTGVASASTTTVTAVVIGNMTQATAEGQSLPAWTLFGCSDCTVTRVCISTGGLHGIVSPVNLAVDCD
jgi:hypothetical protein